MFAISKEYHFSAAHMIPEHPKCSRMHGHNYKVKVTLGSELLTMPQNWVVDFGALDEIMKPLVNALDHHFILTRAQELADHPNKGGWHVSPSAQDDVVKLPIKSSSAESLAAWFAQRVAKAMENWLGIDVMEVIVWETPKASAVWTPSDR